MQSWLDTLWTSVIVIEHSSLYISIPYIYNFWHSREFSLLYLCKKKQINIKPLNITQHNSTTNILTSPMSSRTKQTTHKTSYGS
jgi:hypothetical protein